MSNAQTGASINDSPFERKIRARFSLKLLFLLFLPAGLMAAWLNVRLENTRPLNWETFTLEKLDHRLTERNRFLVFLHPEWSAESMMLKKHLEKPEIKRLIRNAKLKTMIYQLDDYREPEFDRFKKRVFVDKPWSFKHGYLIMFDPEHPTQPHFTDGSHLYNGNPIEFMKSFLKPDSN